MQRLRLKFSRGEELKFLSHLDLMRLWERTLRRAGLPLAYSEGFTPHPQIALAAPLLVGVTSDVELMDVSLSRWVSPQSFLAQIEKQLPRGITLLEARPVGQNVPSLQSQVKFVEYTVEVETEKERQEVESDMVSFLSKKDMPWHHHRDTGDRYYDLRALVDDVRLLDCHDSICVLGMRLRCDEKGAGRPEQVTKALGFSKRPKSIHRTNLILV
ncbi:MAG: TIGR03936 family radical SAM-associated protein [Dehalococcoidia bacterium]|nr:TIGR03936 family radical SAM-associated protein [Dehalococcoidia bacterium]